MQTTSGMTLIEVLVAIAVFAVVIAISSSVTASLSTNKVSQDRLAANQAAQGFFEQVTDLWRNSTVFGTMDATVTPPKTLTGYTWSLTTCEVDMATSDFSCKTGQSATWTSTSKPTLTPTTAATLMKLSLTYTPTGTGSAYVNGTEIYKR